MEIIPNARDSNDSKAVMVGIWYLRPLMRPKARQLNTVHLMTATDELVARIRVASLVGLRSRAGGVRSGTAAVHGAEVAVGRFGGRHVAEGWVVLVDGGEEVLLDWQRRQGLVSVGDGDGLLDGHGGSGGLGRYGGRGGLGSASWLGGFAGHGACSFLGRYAYVRKVDDLAFRWRTL